MVRKAFGIRQVFISCLFNSRLRKFMSDFNTANCLMSRNEIAML